MRPPPAPPKNLSGKPTAFASSSKKEKKRRTPLLFLFLLPLPLRILCTLLLWYPPDQPQVHLRIRPHPCRHPRTGFRRLLLDLASAHHSSRGILIQHAAHPPCHRSSFCRNLRLPIVCPTGWITNVERACMWRERQRSSTTCHLYGLHQFLYCLSKGNGVVANFAAFTRDNVVAAVRRMDYEISRAFLVAILNAP
ncbi:hypothetical protein NL676_003729 [Syzygium grande]|nr:hypothetical protein NL676_003729 [Syzygium grande]